MNDLNQHFHYRKTRKMGEEALGDWLYPNALYGGGCFSDDRTCINIKGQTEDGLDQVRTFYWQKCGFDGAPKPGTSTCSLEGDRAWFIFRSPSEGPNGVQAGLINHITQERTITIFAMPSSQDGLLNLDITRVPHQSSWWKEPALTD